MRRFLAELFLAALILSAFYLFLFLHARSRLHHESIKVEEKLRAFGDANFSAAKLYFESGESLRKNGPSAAQFARLHPGFYATAYSELGMPKQTNLPPIPPQLRPEKAALLGKRTTWLAPRWVIQDVTLWVETLGSSKPWPVSPEIKGAPIFGLATPVAKGLLMDEHSNPELVYAGEQPRGFGRLFATKLDFPGGDASVGALTLHYHVRLWMHALILLLSWGLVVMFVRLLRVRPYPSSQRETQLEEELAYLSKTYQSLSRNLRMERQKVEAILNSAPDGIFTCTPDGIVTFWNKSMEEMTKLRKELTVGKHYRDNMNLCAPGGQLLADPLALRSSHDKHLNLLDCQIETHIADGSSENVVLPVALGAAPVTLADGAVEEMVITVKDIRTQKEAEKLRQDMQAMITHDLRSPLSAILGYAGLLRNAKITKSEEDVEKYLDSLVRAGKEMLILISNLLDWSWVEEGKLSFHKEPLAISPILKEAADSLGVLAKPKNLSIVVGVPEDIWALTDGDKLKEVLNNLVSNAIKFSRPGGTIKVNAHEEGERVRISVADEGPGISPEEKSNLFAKFSEFRKPGSGTGLGLYIVKTLTEALDGTVEVESELGRGSTFSILIPAFQKVATHAQQLSLLSLVGTAEQKTR